MQFKEIIGQENVKERLVNSVKNERISHAQLFLELPGSGALGLAVAYVRYIYCENKQESDSCGECPSCKKVTALEHPDLHFVYPVNTTEKVKKTPISKDFHQLWRQTFTTQPYLSLFEWLSELGIENKQGNISVHESAEILKTLSLKAFEAPYKAVIIWMPEKMNIAASNKLLKIIEEPPEKTLFILVTENYEALLPTILSRTQLVKLERLNDTLIQGALVEKQLSDATSALDIAQLADGNFRQAQALAIQNTDSQEQMTLFRSWMLNCFNKNVAGMITWVDEMATIGRMNQIKFLNYGLQVFRKALIQRFDTDSIGKLQDYESSFITKFATYVHENNCVELIKEFDLAIAHIERNANAKIVFMDLSLKVLMLLLVKSPSQIASA